MAVRAVRAVRAAFRRLQRGKMAAERPEAAAAAASGPGDYASWAPAELRHCLGSIGAAVHGNGRAAGSERGCGGSGRAVGPG